MSELSNMVVSHSRKVQLSQFEPIEFGVTAEVIPEEEESESEAYHSAAIQAQEFVDREIVRRIATKEENSE